MKELKYTLIADGSSDCVLMSIIKWTLDVNFPQLPIKGSYWADLRKENEKPKTIPEKVRLAQRKYPFDILFFHRDAETTDPHILDQRINEIHVGIDDESIINRTVCIIPIKMMETWLLFDVEALKKAAGNRNYSGPISIPKLKHLEKEQQPKDRLHRLLKEISGLKGRNLCKFNPHIATHYVADNISDFSPLRQLKSFQKFENDLITVVTNFLSEN